MRQQLRNYVHMYNQKFETRDHILNLVPVRLLHLLLELSNLHFTLLPQFIKGHLQTAVYLGGQVNFHVSTHCQIELLTEAGQLLTIEEEGKEEWHHNCTLTQMNTHPSSLVIGSSYGYVVC